ncbi:MAG: hypothetical protein J6Q22_11110 [Prevotella sp.]|nr:hypothetical protein [Prevotella sp.]
MDTTELIEDNLNEDWVIRKMASNLADELPPHASKKTLDCLKAALKLIASIPEEYRQRGYSMRDIYFYDNLSNGKSKTKQSVRAAWRKKNQEIP